MAADIIPSTMTVDTLLKTGVLRDKSALERAFERLKESKDLGEFHAVEAVKGARQVAESGLTGAILGAIHAKSKTGLDITAPGATVGTAAVPASKIPVDGVLMAVGFVAGVFGAAEPHGVGKTMMNASAAAAAVYMFRQTNDMMTRSAIKVSGAQPPFLSPTSNAQQAANAPGVISKATFAGEARQGYGAGFHHMSARMHGATHGHHMHGEDPIAALARTLP